MLYQTEPATGTPVALLILQWVLFLLQIGLLLGGIYLAFMRKDTKPLRRDLVRRFGYYAIALGGLGLLLGAATISNTGVFASPFWLYGLAVIELGVSGYAAYVARVQYPQMMSATAVSRSSGAARPKPTPAVKKVAPSAPSEPTPPPEPPRTARRGARRDRKRKSR